MADSPTQRSKRHLEADGYTVAIVEKWNPHAGIRQDLFGFIDLLALRAGETLAVQTTTSSNLAARVRKIEASDLLAVVQSAGWRVVGHGWSLPAGAKKWALRTVEIT